MVLVGALVAVVSISVVAYLGGRHSSARAGCVDVTVATATGGATLHNCGAAGRQFCMQSQQAGNVSAAVASACRRAGYPLAGR